MLCTKTLQKPCRGCGSNGREYRVGSRWWLPGIVVIEFERDLSPGSIFGTSQPILEKTKDWSWVDLRRLRQLVGNELVKPPEWTFSFKPGQVPSRPNYLPFITLTLGPDEDIPAIARQLSNVQGVKRASPEPILSPPIPRIPFTRREMPRRSALSADFFADTVAPVGLRNEPLAVSGGESFGIQTTVTNDDVQNQWYLFRSKVDEVVANNIDGTGVVVADIDWGFNVDHQEFQNRIQFKLNAAQNSDDLSSGPDKWHGTAALGLIGAGDNDAGMLGFASGADLWAIMGQDTGPNLDNQCWANAIDKAIEESSNGKRKVILVEASTDGQFNIEASSTVREPIRAAINAGCVVCVPAGNRGVDATRGPGFIRVRDDENECQPILVGATKYTVDDNDIQRGASNFGPRVIVSAPGEIAADVSCCNCGNDTYTNFFGGTSGASAKVAGAMALVLQQFPEVTHRQIVDVLKTRMPQIPTPVGREMGCFLDVSELMYQVDSYLAGI
jgi:subtilisin family serine protease